MDAEGPRLVARRRHHAPVAETADHDRLPPELGPIPLLDGRVERVEIEVEDRWPAHPIDTDTTSKLARLSPRTS